MEKTITFTACGDIGIYRQLETKLINEHVEAILGDSISIFKGADLSFANLEGPVSNTGKREGLPPPYPSLRMHPKSIDLLAEGGFDIVSLANNHMLDYGPDALLDTIDRLNFSNIKHFGAGKNEVDACAFKVVHKNDIRIGFLGYHAGGADSDDGSPGACKFNFNKAKVQIKELKKLVDVIVISMHFGFDYFTSPSPYHVKLCRKLIDEGADLILGHHPHVSQGVEKYKKGLIAYSLGNFAFYLGDKASPGTKEGFILKVKIGKSGIMDYSKIPYKLKGNLEISILQGSERSEKLCEYEKLSEKLKTNSIIRKDWYQNVRNFYLGYIFYYWKFDVKKNKNVLEYIKRLLKLLKPSGSSSILLKSLIVFTLSGFAISQEAKLVLSKINLKFR